MYHISVYFDKKTEARMRDDIKKVAEATGNTYMLDAQVPPHITLLALECEQEEELVRRLENLVSDGDDMRMAELQPGTIRWVSVGSFLPGVIFLQPVLNEYLQGLMQQVYDSVKNVQGCRVRPCYRPFSWLPHCTIAKKLTSQQLLQAFEVLQREFAVLEGQVVRVGLAKMNPHREIASWVMKK